MGLLTEGKALSPDEMKDVLQYIREHGITQFLNTWERVKDLQEDELRFGDEIECGLYVVNSTDKSVKLILKSAELRQKLTAKEKQFEHETEGCTWHPEFGAWMIESTPSRPYNNFASGLLRVESNMLLRRRRLLSVLQHNEIAPTMTCFPLLGAGDFIADVQPFASPVSRSLYLPDRVINPHPRFAALVRNIRARRGSKVNISVPLFHDKHTPEFLRSEKSNTTRGTLPANDEVVGSSDAEAVQKILAAAKQDAIVHNFPEGYCTEPDTNIHMDAMGFGMGMSCLQVTFQARDVDESRYMFDQLAVLAPIMLAITASTPMFKGRLADIDVRWSTIAASVDCRTPAERGVFDRSTEEGKASIAASTDPRMVGGGVAAIPKSRYDSISTYIYHCQGDTACQRTFEVYNDVPCPVDKEVKDRLRASGIDENLAHHVAHLFCRDPLVVFEGMVELDDKEVTDHFESLQSTNWQTCRWKPPPPRHSDSDPHIGWRTEFRSMEVQLTDFENAAFTVFVVLLTRVVLAFDLGFYIPLSKVDENMRRAHVRNAVETQRFFFRKHIAPPAEEVLDCLEDCIKAESQRQIDATATVRNVVPPPAPCYPPQQKTPSPCSGRYAEPLSAEDSYEEMSLGEIFGGKGSYFPGLLPLVYAYLEYINCDATTFKRISQYLDFIEKRATGQLMTPATWMRKFVTTHRAYRNDSVISPEIAHDLMLQCQGIGLGTISCPELLGDVKIERVRKEDAYGQVLAGRLSCKEKSQLLRGLIARANSPRSANAPRGKTRASSFADNESVAKPNK